MKKLWLGRYISVPSFYHSLDSRAKLLMMVLNIIMMICISRWTQLLLAACLIFIFLYLSKIPFSFYLLLYKLPFHQYIF